MILGEGSVEGKVDDDEADCGGDVVVVVVVVVGAVEEGCIADDGVVVGSEGKAREGEGERERGALGSETKREGWRRAGLRAGVLAAVKGGSKTKSALCAAATCSKRRSCSSR